MKRPHLLRAAAEPAAFEALVELSAAAGYRTGWLELDSNLAAAPPLSEAVAAGASRAVAVTPSGSISVKARHGSWVLDDLLREHFLGCRLVLVRGPLDAAAGEIELSGPGRWTLRFPGDAPRAVTADEFLRWLRTPPVSPGGGTEV